MSAADSFKQECPSCDALVPIKDRTFIGKKIECPKCKYRFVVEPPRVLEDEDIGLAPEDDPPPAPVKPSPAKPQPAAKPAPAAVTKAVATKELPAKSPATPAKAQPAMTQAKPKAKDAPGKDDNGKSKPGAATVKKAAGPAADPKKKPAGKKPLVDDDDDDDDKPRLKKKPKKGGSGGFVVIMGVGLSLVAVVLLVVAFYFILGSSDTGALATKPKPVLIPTSSGPAPPDTGKPPPDPGPGPSEEVTRLLPNDTEAVYSINVKELQESMMGRAAFDAPGAFHKELIQEKLGLLIGNLEEILIGCNLSNDTYFCIFKSRAPFNMEQVKLALNLKEGEKVKNQEYFVTEPSAWLENLSHFMGRILPNFYQPKPGRKDRKLGVAGISRVAGSCTTLVIADLEPMKKFLDEGCAPSLKNIPGGGVGMGQFGQPKTVDVKAKAPPSDRFLSVEPPLKAMLDQLELKGTNEAPPMITMAWNMTKVSARVKTLLEGLKPLTPTTVDDQAISALNQITTAGLAIKLDKNDLTLKLGIEGTNKDIVTRDLPEKVQAGAAALGEKWQVTLNGGAAGKGKGTKLALTTLPLDKSYIIQGKISLTDLESKWLLDNFLGPRMMIVRGLMEMAEGGTRVHDLAAAVRAMMKDRETAGMKSFPRGTCKRDSENDGRPWPPSQRVSWMVELLPYLGQKKVRDHILIGRSWRPEGNFTVNAQQGSVLVPAFLDPANGVSAWWLYPPGLDRSYAATDFVGIAGVGLDAADYPYDLNNKKLGIFGYDRETPVADVKDGLENTILIIQVPPSYRRPWIAGGGATVTGVPEKGSIQPFVLPKDVDVPGKGPMRGTYAIMADGSVRFIFATIPDDVFQAMCTINGGEKVDMDKHSVLIPPPAGKAVLQAQPGLPEPAPGPLPAPTPAPNK